MRLSWVFVVNLAIHILILFFPDSYPLYDSLSFSVNVFLVFHSLYFSFLFLLFFFFLLSFFLSVNLLLFLPPLHLLPFISLHLSFHIYPLSPPCSSHSNYCKHLQFLKYGSGPHAISGNPPPFISNTVTSSSAPLSPFENGVQMFHIFSTLCFLSI